MAEQEKIRFWIETHLDATYVVPFGENDVLEDWICGIGRRI